MGTPTLVYVIIRSDWYAYSVLCDYGRRWVRQIGNQSQGYRELGGGTGVRVGGGGRGRRHREGNDERIYDLNDQGNDQGMGANRGVEEVNGNVEGANRGVPDFLTIIAQQLQNLLPAMLAQVDNQRNVRNQNCNVDNENVQENVGNVLVNGNQISSALTDEAVRNGSIKKVDKKGNIGEHSKDKIGMDDNKRTRIGNVFSTTINPVGRENTSTWPKGMPRNVNPVNARNPLVRACYECGSTDPVRSACPRWNRAQGPRGNRQNQVVANNEGQGRGNQRNQARGRAFMLRTEEAR
nr:hypothetical protein [Tanacetum cinerariifolium]